jgi:hypothetical protein
MGLFLSSGCEKSQLEGKKALADQGTCVTGVLVKAGICGQRVIKITSQNKGGLAYAARWEDQSSGKTYENVFTVAKSCAFPTTMKEGEQINFKLTTDTANECAQCLAFTPVPGEKNNIIINADCAGVQR